MDVIFKNTALASGSKKLLVKLTLVALLLVLSNASGGMASAQGLLRIAGCRLVDDKGPVKAMGVNYVDGFWAFAKDGDRTKYLPDLDALAEAKIPFIRIALGPWGPLKVDGPPAPEIVDFVRNRDRYFDRLDVFLDDAKARHLGVVLDVFWNVDPYLAYFGEPEASWPDPKSRTGLFLREVVKEIARRRGADPTIWMIEFLNEGDLLIDFPHAPHSRADLVALINGLAGVLRASGDRHLVDTGNSLPRPAAKRLGQHQGWTADSRADFVGAMDAETPTGSPVASVHIYPEDKAARPWDGGDVLSVLPVLTKTGLKACHPVFIGEFGAPDSNLEQIYIKRIARSDIQLSAIWGFGRAAGDPLYIGLNARGRALLRQIGLAARTPAPAAAYGGKP